MEKCSLFILALENSSPNVTTAVASRKPSAALSQTPDLIKFATTGKAITITDNNTKKPIVVVKGNYSSTIKGDGLYLRRETGRVG